MQNTTFNNNFQGKKPLLQAMISHAAKGYKNDDLQFLAGYISAKKHDDHLKLNTVVELMKKTFPHHYKAYDLYIISLEKSRREAVDEAEKQRNAELILYILQGLCVDMITFKKRK